MFCKYCGKQLPDGDIYPECAAKLEEKASASGASAAPVPQKNRAAYNGAEITKRFGIGNAITAIVTGIACDISSVLGFVFALRLRRHDARANRSVPLDGTRLFRCGGCAFVHFCCACRSRTRVWYQVYKKFHDGKSAGSKACRDARFRNNRSGLRRNQPVYDAYGFFLGACRQRSRGIT